MKKLGFAIFATMFMLSACAVKETKEQGDVTSTTDSVVQEDKVNRKEVSQQETERQLVNYMSEVTFLDNIIGNLGYNLKEDTTDEKTINDLHNISEEMLGKHYDKVKQLSNDAYNLLKENTKIDPDELEIVEDERQSTIKLIDPLREALVSLNKDNAKETYNILNNKINRQNYAELSQSYTADVMSLAHGTAETDSEAQDVKTRVMRKVMAQQGDPNDFMKVFGEKPTEEESLIQIDPIK